MTKKTAKKTGTKPSPTRETIEATTPAWLAAAAITVPPCLGWGDGQFSPHLADELEVSHGPMIREWLNVIDTDRAPRRNSRRWRAAREISAQLWPGEEQPSWSELGAFVRDLWDVWAWTSHVRIAGGVAPSVALDMVDDLHDQIDEARAAKAAGLPPIEKLKPCLCPKCERLRYGDAPDPSLN